MALSDLVFPSRCAGCGRLGPSPCAWCIGRLCVLSEANVGGPVDRCLVLLDYDDLARRLITKIKYGAVRTGIAWFAEALASRVRDAGESIDLVTWVPATPRHRRRRGFDQGEALATPVAHHLGATPVGLLRRRDRRGQTGRSRLDRLAGPALELRSGRVVAGHSVLVVDDVLTTGASLRAAGAALTGAGAGRVVAAVVARRRLATAGSW